MLLLNPKLQNKKTKILIFVTTQCIGFMLISLLFFSIGMYRLNYGTVKEGDTNRSETMWDLWSIFVLSTLCKFNKWPFLESTSW